MRILVGLLIVLLLSGCGTNSKKIMEDEEANDFCQSEEMTLEKNMSYSTSMTYPTILCSNDEKLCTWYVWSSYFELKECIDIRQR